VKDDTDEERRGHKESSPKPEINGEEEQKHDQRDIHLDRNTPDSGYFVGRTEHNSPYPPRNLGHMRPKCHRIWENGKIVIFSLSVLTINIDRSIMPPKERGYIHIPCQLTAEVGYEDE
jgi:hypothetical protein